MSIATEVPYYSTGQLAEHYGVRPWQVRRCYALGLLEEPARRVGVTRLVPASDLPKVEAALVQAGYLPARGKAAKAARA
jgi:hypothetical protein